MKPAMMTRREALEMFESDDLIGLGVEADAVRRKLHPEGIVSYLIERRIEYIGADGSTVPEDAIFERIQETIDRGGTGIVLHGGLRPDITIEWLEVLLRSIKARFPVETHGFCAPAPANIARASGLTLRDTIARLRDAGLDSIPGGGAETPEWGDTHRIAHGLGMCTTAVMRFGGGETAEQRLNHLELVRQIQEETGGFQAFLPWSFPGRAVKEEPTAVEYLKMLAISRVYLDNIPNAQSSWVMPGLKTCQVGLRFGGNDVGSIRMEDGAHMAGAHHQATEEQLRRLIRDAGFVPKQRDPLYRSYFLN